MWSLIKREFKVISSLFVLGYVTPPRVLMSKRFRCDVGCNLLFFSKDTPCAAKDIRRRLMQRIASVHIDVLLLGGAEDSLAMVSLQ